MPGECKWTLVVIILISAGSILSASYLNVQGGLLTPGQGMAHTYQMHDPRQHRLMAENHVTSTVSETVHIPITVQHYSVQIYIHEHVYMHVVFLHAVNVGH